MALLFSAHLALILKLLCDALSWHISRYIICSHNSIENICLIVNFCDAAVQEGGCCVRQFLKGRPDKFFTVNVLVLYLLLDMLCCIVSIYK